MNLTIKGPHAVTECVTRLYFAHTENRPKSRPPYRLRRERRPRFHFEIDAVKPPPAPHPFVRSRGSRTHKFFVNQQVNDFRLFVDDLSQAESRIGEVYTILNDDD